MVFYAGMNLGFGSGYKSQVNEAMLQAACYDLLTDLHNFNIRNHYDSELVKPNPEHNHNDLLLINNSFPPDSPFVAKDDSILTTPDSPFVVKDDSILTVSDSTDLINLLDSTSIMQTDKGKDSLK
ncbi:MAG: hypothetical protein Q8M94_01125, partial [Ignavibacteria bacterium]|nr:hypothetical protein [Ignavibacteria bacterium]